ncbi:MAG: protein phosphatase 2C domain-containing protein [Sandaracinaceae bacterium]|nr:hypothetical protein [Myxococcales bacterium]
MTHAHTEAAPFDPGPQTLPNLRGASEAPTRSRDVGGLTHVGGREKNEDQFLVADVSRCVAVRASSLAAAPGGTLAASEGTVLVVADGMGGHGSGDLASAVTVDGVVEWLAHHMPWSETLDDAHRRALIDGVGEMARSVQARLWSVAARKHASPKLGTTLVMAYLLERELFVAHVGDSRAYLLREGRLDRITEDHSLAERVRKESGDGGADLDLSHLSHILVNAIGGDRQEPRVDGAWFQLTPGDRVMLASDGLTDVVGDEAIAEHLSAAESADEACHLLVRAAMDASTSDNVTVVSAFV